MGMPATHMHHHLHVPWLTIIVVIIAVAIAAAILYAVNRDTTTTEAPAVSVVAPVAATAAVPRAENRAFFNLVNWWVHDYMANMRSAAVMADYATLHQPPETAQRVTYSTMGPAGGEPPSEAYRQIHLQP